MLKFTEKPKALVRFDTLRVGDTFIYEEALGIKLDLNNILWIADKELDYAEPQDLVRRINLLEIVYD